MEFSGTLNTGGYSPALTLSQPSENYGWNLIGNDFPSAIDWGTQNTPVPGYTHTNIDATIYFWNGSQYATYNPTGDGSGNNGGTQYIAAMQGFFVHAYDASPELTIPQGARLHNSQNFRNPRANDESISLTVHSNNYSDEVIIKANDNATAGFDTQYDAYKLYGIDNAPQFYNITDNDILSVNNQPMVDHKIDAPLGLLAGSPEVHTIIANGTDSFNGDVTISLEDLKEDVIINLRTDSTYSFFSSPSDDPNRFILHIDASTVNTNDFYKPMDNLIYTFNNNIIIENTNGNNLEGTVSIYDLLGRLQFMSTLQNAKKQTFEPHLSNGIYLITIINNSNVQSKKIKIN